MIAGRGCFDCRSLHVEKRSQADENNHLPRLNFVHVSFLCQARLARRVANATSILASASRNSASSSLPGTNETDSCP
ncbi:hypothetical protein ALQ50_200078 [Pseudomonas coronafaciens pv. coronafaciens]|nr:hypothetical protein ALQ50_200078 [Pseudomonas coronafaciens pv. coronafaciens]